MTLHNLALGYIGLGLFDRALPPMERSLEGRKRKLGPDHPDTLTSMLDLSSIFQATGRYDRAFPLLEQAVDGRKRKLGPDHPDTIVSIRALANCYRDAGQPDRSASLCRELADLIRRHQGPENPQYASAINSLGLALLEQEKWPEAETSLREALAIRERIAPDAWTTSLTRSLLGGALLGSKQYAAAGPALVAGYEGMKRQFAEVPPVLMRYPVEALDRLIRLAEATGKPDEPRAWNVEKARITAPTGSAARPDAGKP